MKELVRIEKKNGIETVNARDLHAGLEAGDRFDQWIQRRIEKYGFVEGSDFCTELCESTGGRPSKEYYLTIDMAKELAMVENNEHGRKIRQYFIKVEKQFKAIYKKDLEQRVKSKKIRVEFTDTLKDHGIEKPIEYIKITSTMKKSAGIPGNKKKDDMNRVELATVMAYEAYANLQMVMHDPHGYDQVKPICQQSAVMIGNSTLQIQ